MCSKSSVDPPASTNSFPPDKAFHCKYDAINVVFAALLVAAKNNIKFLFLASKKLSCIINHSLSLKGGWVILSTTSSKPLLGFITVNGIGFLNMFKWQ